MTQTNKALEAARLATQAKRDAGETIERRNPAEKLADSPTSKACAIAAKCFDCVGATNADHGFRRAIRECAAPKCALYQVRPYR